MDEDELKPDLRTPFEKFEDLARRAFSTPKEEVEARIAEDEAKRERVKVQKPAQAN